jgi:hypothetical protein
MIGRSVHCPVWMPFKHPMTGRRVNMLCNYTDRLIPQEEADKLHSIYNLPAAPGSLRMSDGIV